MKYINTREAYLNSINETFSNEITFGGSLIGRLVNSIIRKAKIEINYQKVKSIAQAIKIELDGMIANGLSEENRQEIAKITAKALLEEIYNVVTSDESEKVKLYQLLDTNKDGLITQAINFLEILPEGTNLGKGTKEELIEKLKKFKSLLESISENTEELTDEEKEEVEKKVDNEEEEEDEHDLEEVPMNEEDDFETTYKLLQSILGMHKYIAEKNTNNIGDGNKKQDINTYGSEAQDEPSQTSTEITKSKPGMKQHPDISITKKEPQLLNRGSRGIEQGSTQKQIGSNTNNTRLIGSGQKESLLNFWNFFSTINEFKIDAPRTKASINGPKSKLNVINGDKKENPKSKQGEYIDYEMVDDDNVENKTQDQQPNIWEKIIRVWKKSGISEHIPMISSLLEKSKDENAVERKWISRIGKQLKVNALTHGKHMHSNLVSEASSDVISTDIPKSISLLANAFFSLKNSNIIKTLDKFGTFLETFNSCYDVIVKPEKNLKSEKPKDNLDKNEPNKLGSENTNKPNTDIVKSENIINNFLDLLKEADLPEPEHELEETEVEDENTNLSVKGAWEQVFMDNEQNEWKLSNQEAKQAQDKLKNAKFEINLTDENNKDRLIKITNLFGRAYRCYVTSVIPSGRPGGKVSNNTFREYIHLGTGGSPGTPDSPGAGPWASRRVFNNFVNYISSYIENEDYKQIFNYGKIKRTDGKLLKGNVLLEFIRDMIDETALKSFDKRRSEFLNKYFGLEGYTYKEPEGASGKGTTKSEHAEIDETLQWQSINNITTANVTNIEKGSFLAFNVRFKLDGKKEEHKVIIGQVLDIKDGNKVILKWLYDNEAIPHAYAAAKLTHGYSYTTTDLKKPPRAEAAPKEPLYVGLIDLTLKLKTKTDGGESETETQGVIPNHNFFMVFKDITKPDNNTDHNYHRVHFVPYKNKPGVVNRVIKNAISILVKSDKQDNKNPLIGKLDTLASKSIIPTDKQINIDETIEQLTNYMDRNRDKI